jgi:predicted nucleic acid-binding protein
VREVVIDASVMVASLRPKEPFHRVARETIRRLGEQSARGEVRLVEPPVWRLEVWNSAQRIDGVDQDWVRILETLAVEFQPVEAGGVEEFLAWVSHLPACPSVRRGADFEYLLVARARHATLVTLDPGMLDCAGFGVAIVEAQAYR